MTERSVFVTGALGFIGRAVSDRFRAEGCTVRGVDVTADPSRDVVAGDVRTPGPWQAHASDCDVVVHTAAVVSNVADSRRAWEVNVLGTRHVVDAAGAGRAGRIVRGG